MVGVGVVGYGYWGPNVLRNFAESKGADLRACCDLDGDRLSLAKTRYPAISVTQRFEDLLADDRIDALAICTPVDTHYPLAKRALEAGRHVLVEKPMASSAREANELVELAAAKNRVLMVGHVFAYTGPVRKLKELVDSGHLGEILYYDSVRINLGLFQHDVSVIWDLAVHDLSIVDYLLPEKPAAVSAVGISHVAGQPENTAYVTLFFPGNILGHIHVNWLAPVKLRRTLIGGSQKMAVYDDLEPSEKIKVYDKGVVVKDDPAGIHEMLVGYRTGDMWAPKLDMSEGLRAEVDHFVHCIEDSSTPLTDGMSGLRVVQILEEATASMAQKGTVMTLTSPEGN
jgi:predicted dehydrogenase